MPKLERWLGRKMRDRLERDISVCRKYFDDFFLDTRLVTGPDGNIATVQPFLNGHYLSKHDMSDPVVQAHFEEFMRRYDAMVRDGNAEIDLVGQGGVFRRRFSNVLVLPSGDLKLFDAAVLDTMGIGIGKTFVRLVITLVLKRQSSTLRFLRS